MANKRYVDGCKKNTFYMPAWRLPIDKNYPNDVGKKNYIETECFKETLHLTTLDELHQYKINSYLKAYKGNNNDEENLKEFGFFRILYYAIKNKIKCKSSNTTNEYDCLSGALWHVNKWYILEKEKKRRSIFWLLFVIPIIKIAMTHYVKYIECLSCKDASFFTRILWGTRYMLCPEKRLQDIEKLKKYIEEIVIKYNEQLIRLE